MGAKLDHFTIYYVCILFTLVAFSVLFYRAKFMSFYMGAKSRVSYVARLPRIYIYINSFFIVIQFIHRHVKVQTYSTVGCDDDEMTRKIDETQH